MNIFRSINPKVATQIPEAPIVRFLFADKRMAWFWLFVRLSVGLGWLAAGVSKLTGFAFGLKQRENSESRLFDSSGGARIGKRCRRAGGLLDAAQFLNLWNGSSGSPKKRLVNIR